MKGKHDRKSGINNKHLFSIGNAWNRMKEDLFDGFNIRNQIRDRFPPSSFCVFLSDFSISVMFKNEVTGFLFDWFTFCIPAEEISVNPFSVFLRLFWLKLLNDLTMK